MSRERRQIRERSRSRILASFAAIIGSMRILLVEDERRVASFVCRALRENAYAVDLAETGEKALEMAKETPYDSILLDVRLPGLSGIQVCRELRGARIDAPILM